MITDHYIKCGACPKLLTEEWPGGAVAAMCSDSAHYGHPRVLSVTPGRGADPGQLTVRARWCHSIAQQNVKKNGRSGPQKRKGDST